MELVIHRCLGCLIIEGEVLKHSQLTGSFKRLYEYSAAAIWSIKTTYGLKRKWQGDPCFPQASAWDGINCSYNNTVTPRIISLNLSSSGLSGEIAAALANLTMLQSLDLSYNNLTGTVPKFLASLDFLKIFNLTGNNFTRPLPPELLAKSKNGLLALSIETTSDQDTGACPKDSCKNNKHNKVVTPVIATIASFFVLLIILALLWIYKRRQTQDPRTKDELIEQRNPQQQQQQQTKPNPVEGSVIEQRNRRFTYLEVATITNGFSTSIGRGGF